MATNSTKGAAMCLEHKLTVLNMQFLERPLDHLCTNFDGFPFEYEDDCFENELDTALADLITLKAAGESNEQLVHRLKIKLGSFSAWKYRAFVGTTPRQYWNPLEQTYSDFSSEGTGVKTQRVDEIYPPKDMLRSWSNLYLAVPA